MRQTAPREEQQIRDVFCISSWLDLDWNGRRMVGCLRCRRAMTLRTHWPLFVLK